MKLRNFLFGTLVLPCLVLAHQDDHQGTQGDQHVHDDVGEEHHKHGHDHSHRHASAHVHGEAKLDIAVQAQMIYIEFESPAANIVGFEHAPKSSAQRGLLQDAANLLSTPGDLFQFGVAKCLEHKVTVRMPHTGEQHDDSVSHSSVYASYQFECDDLAQLDDLMVQLFSRFPALQKIAVQWIAPHGQGAATLTAKANRFKMH